jgi:hypothetical protein
MSPQEAQQLKNQVAQLEQKLALIIQATGYTFIRPIKGSPDSGLKIGTASRDKLGFYGNTPIVRPSSTGEFSGHNGGAGTALTHKDTFIGSAVGVPYSTAYTLNDIVKHLKALGILEP